MMSLTVVIRVSIASLTLAQSPGTVTQLAIAETNVCGESIEVGLPSVTFTVIVFPVDDNILRSL